MSELYDLTRFSLNGNAEKMKQAGDEMEQAYRIIESVCEGGYGSPKLSMIRDMLKAAIYENDDKFAELFDPYFPLNSLPKNKTK